MLCAVRHPLEYLSFVRHHSPIYFVILLWSIADCCCRWPSPLEAKIKLAFGLAGKYLWFGFEPPAQNSSSTRVRVPVQHSRLQFDCILTRGSVEPISSSSLRCDAGKTISSIWKFNCYCWRFFHLHGQSSPFPLCSFICPGAHRVQIVFHYFSDSALVAAERSGSSSAFDCCPAGSWIFSDLSLYLWVTTAVAGHLIPRAAVRITWFPF